MKNDEKLILITNECSNKRSKNLLATGSEDATSIFFDVNIEKYLQPLIGHIGIKSLKNILN